MEQEDTYAVIVSQVNTATLGAGYDGDFYTFKEFDIGVPQAVFARPSQEIEITAGAYVDVELLLQVNYLGGPTISLRPFAEIVLQSAPDQKEYCQIEHSTGYMGGVDWGLSVVVGAEFSPPFLGDNELKVPLAKELVFYEPVRDFCLVSNPSNPEVGEPLLHHTSWVGTMESCLPDLQGQVVDVEVIYRTMRDGTAEFEIVYNDPCTGIGFFDADPVNTPNQTGVRLIPSSLTLSMEGAEPDAFCEPQDDVYNKYDFEQIDQPIVSNDILEELALTFTNGWENIELQGECTTIQATFGREPWLDAAAVTLTCYWLSFVPFVAAFVAAFVA